MFKINYILSHHFHSKLVHRKIRELTLAFKYGTKKELSSLAFAHQTRVYFMLNIFYSYLRLYIKKTKAINKINTLNFFIKNYNVKSLSYSCNRKQNYKF